jgi:PAP2 superfamily
MISTPFWPLLTDFGDSAVLAPAALLIAAWLAAGQAWRGALRWCLFFGVGLLLTVSSKIAFIGWGIGFRAIDFTGVSGHTMLATSIYGTGLWLAMPRSQPGLRAMGVVVGLLAGGLVGMSRLALGVHSPAEVVAGFTIGALVCLGFVASSGGIARPAIPPLVLVAGWVAVTAGMYGDRAPSEGLIAQVALRLSGHDRPYVRATWLGSEGGRLHVGGQAFAPGHDGHAQFR